MPKFPRLPNPIQYFKARARSKAEAAARQTQHIERHSVKDEMCVSLTVRRYGHGGLSLTEEYSSTRGRTTMDHHVGDMDAEDLRRVFSTFVMMTCTMEDAMLNEPDQADNFFLHSDGLTQSEQIRNSLRTHAKDSD